MPTHALIHIDRHTADFLALPIQGGTPEEQDAEAIRRANDDPRAIGAVRLLGDVWSGPVLAPRVVPKGPAST